MEKLLDALGIDRSSSIGEIYLDAFYSIALSASGRLSPLCWVVMLLICLALYLRRQPGESFWKWVFPRRSYSGATFWVDIKLMFFNALLGAFGLFAIVGFAPLVANSLQNLLAGETAPQSNLSPLVITLILFAAADLSTYLVHRLGHEWRPFWPFHAVHHSAEELNPFTVNRKHPVYSLVSSFVRGLLTGLVQGVLLGLLVGKIEFATILGANVFIYAFNVTGANLRHTHIWLSYGPVLEHILISPAQHQVHHSIDPKHFNKNYGQTFAIWDWMFGSLYIPKGREELTFGLADGRGKPLKQIHPTLRAALIEPFVTSARRKTEYAEASQEE